MTIGKLVLACLICFAIFGALAALVVHFRNR